MSARDTRHLTHCPYHRAIRNILTVSCFDFETDVEKFQSFLCG